MFHHVAPAVESDLDALERLGANDREMCNALQTLYCALASESKERTLSIFRAKFRRGINVAALTSGVSVAHRRRIKDTGYRILDFQLDRGDEAELHHFGAVMEILNDKFERLDRGRPFKEVGRLVPSVASDSNEPFFTFKICVL